VPAFLSQASFHRSETQLANGHPLNEFKHYESLSQGAVDAGDAILDSANGLFTSIGTTEHAERSNRHMVRSVASKVDLD
jgi:hypothetical protein